MKAALVMVGDDPDSNPRWLEIAGGTLYHIGTLNAVDSLIACAVILLVLLMLLHRIVWPPIGRLIQVVRDEHVLLKRWPLFFAGVGILCATWPEIVPVAKIFGLKS